MVVIVAQIRNFRYFLRFDEKFEEAWAEGLINNATVMKEDWAEEVLSFFGSIWPLSIEHFENF